MTVRNPPLARINALVLIAFVSLAVSKSNGDNAIGKGTPVLWRNPGGESRNLLYGAGAKGRSPHGPFTFLKEDSGGSSPKYNVRDRDGIKWKIKLGAEARSETTASRLVWAAGFYTNEDYFVPELHVEGLPAHLKRHRQIAPDGMMHNARLKREAEGEEKVSKWNWHDNPFSGKREWNGLRVLMALLNNWDVKDENNAVYRKDGELIYMVSDLGATFGAPGRSWPASRSKDNLQMYRGSRFICGETENLLDFCAPSRPSLAHLLDPLEFARRMKLRWIGNDIPRADARWLGELLARLSPQQIRDAFRAGGYSANEVEAFSSVVSRRIGELTEL